MQLMWKAYTFQFMLTQNSSAGPLKNGFVLKRVRATLVDTAPATIDTIAAMAKGMWRI